MKDSPATPHAEPAMVPGTQRVRDGAYIPPLAPEEVAAIDGLFSYHAPDAEQILKLGKLRSAARDFAVAIVENCPRSADRAAAIRQLRDCVMTANASLILEPLRLKSL